MEPPVCTPSNSVEPALAVCNWCAGAGREPEDEWGALNCGICDGGGYSPVAGDLGPTKAYRKRSFVYNPGLKRLVVNRDRQLTEYEIVEYLPDLLSECPDARAFRFEKLPDRSAYFLLIHCGGISCDCAGKEWETSAKTNAREYIFGGEMFVTLGCVHADFLRRGFDLGLFDAV